MSSYFHINDISKTLDIVVSSPLCCLSQYAVHKILAYRYPQSLLYHTSCMNLQKDKLWCNKCNKCLRSYLIYKNLSVKVKNLECPLEYNYDTPSYDTIILKCMNNTLDGYIHTINSNALKLIDNSDKFNKIYSEYFTSLEHNILLSYPLGKNIGYLDPTHW